MRARIAIVTYNWPPRNAIGTHRPYSWAKYLSEAGFEVTVVTAQKQVFDGPLDLCLPPIQGVRVIEVGRAAASPARWFPGFAVRFKGPLRRIYRAIRAITWGGLDARDWWASAAYPVVKELATEVDFVISTFGPRSSHLIASVMKGVNPTLFWVADYRDLWSYNHLSRSSARALRAERDLEQATIRGEHPANLLTTISKELCDELADQFGGRVEAVYNGFEPSDPVEPVPRTWSGKKIIYTGALYDGYRDPSLLFRAIRKLADDNLLKVGDLSVDFYGPTNRWLEGLIVKFGVSDFVSVCAPVSRSKALGLQAAADALLLLENPDRSAFGTLTGKLFEYINAKRPILSIGSLPGSAIARVMSECGVGVCVGTSEDDCCRVLRELLAADTGWYKPQNEEIAKYSRATQARRLVELLPREKIDKTR